MAGGGRGYLVQYRSVDIGGDDFESGHSVGEQGEAGAGPCAVPCVFLEPFINVDAIQPSDCFQRYRRCKTSDSAPDYNGIGVSSVGFL